MTDAEGNEIGKVFIGGLSQSTNDDSLRNYFRQFGCIEDCVVMMDNKTGRSRGFGYIKFDDERTVLIVLDHSAPHLLDGKIVDVKQCNVHMKGRNRRSLKIFVGGIGLDDNEESIRKYFSQFGIVTDVNLMLDQAKQRHRGFAFVGFEDETVVKDLIGRHFLSMNGKHVEIKAMEPPNFARKLLSAEVGNNNSTINTNQATALPGIVFCNPLTAADQSNTEEKLLRIQPQYSIQPVVWSNPVNTNGVWSNPYQFDKVSPNFIYPPQNPASCPHFHQYIPNSNQGMWGMMPAQPTAPWGYQMPLGNNSGYQYPSGWQYPYVLQYPQPIQQISARLGEMGNLGESKLQESQINRNMDENPQQNSVTENRSDSSSGYETNERWIYGNTINKESGSGRLSEAAVRPNGDENIKNSFGNKLSDFSFFQPNY